MYQKANCEHIVPKDFCTDALRVHQELIRQSIRSDVNRNFWKADEKLNESHCSFSKRRYGTSSSTATHCSVNLSSTPSTLASSLWHCNLSTSDFTVKKIKKTFCLDNTHEYKISIPHNLLWFAQLHHEFLQVLLLLVLL